MRYNSAAEVFIIIFGLTCDRNREIKISRQNIFGLTCDEIEKLKFAEKKNKKTLYAFFLHLLCRKKNAIFVNSKNSQTSHFYAFFLLFSCRKKKRFFNILSDHRLD